MMRKNSCSICKLIGIYLILQSDFGLIFNLLVCKVHVGTRNEILVYIDCNLSRQGGDQVIQVKLLWYSFALFLLHALWHDEAAKMIFMLSLPFETFVKNDIKRWTQAAQQPSHQTYLSFILT